MVEIREKVNLAMQLKINRIRKGYSVDELARKSGVAKSTIFSIEQERFKMTKLDTIITLGEVLNVSLEELIVERKAVAC